MDDSALTSLETDSDASGHVTVDITTYGARSGQERRIEIWLYRAGGSWYLTGTPAKRAWYANLLADPRLIVHTKRGPSEDLPASATPLTDPEERRRVLTEILDALRSRNPSQADSYDLDRWIEGAPLAEVRFA